MAELGTVLGVRFEYDSYPVDGFQLTLTDADTLDTLYDYRVIGATLWEAVADAVSTVWAEELAKHPEDDDLGYRVASALKIEEAYFDEEDEEDD